MSVISFYGEEVCREGVSRVVRTTELEGTTGCHGKLMKLQQANEERYQLAIRPQAGVVGSLAMSGCYRRCSVVACEATDRSSMAVQWVLME
jgi:hypothetical protein